MTRAEALAWIADLFEEAADHVLEATPRSEVPAWDSLGVLSLMADLDEKFDIQLTEAEINEMAEVGDILEILKKHGALAD